MPRQAATKVYANFTGGLVTEANQLSYPENAAIDIDNIDINEDGSVQRRAGLAYDGLTDSSLPATSLPIVDVATAVFRWDAVNGDTGINIAVMQVADRLDFYYIRDNEILATQAAASITLTAPTRPSASTLELRQSATVDMISGGGRLYVVGPYIEPFVLEFTEPATEWGLGTLSQTDLELNIRDFGIAQEGVLFNPSDPTSLKLDGSERQDYMSGAHFYNLANQGWPHQLLASNFIVEANAKVSSSSDPDGGTTDADPAEYTYDELTFFPTTKDLFHTYQAGGGQTVTEQIAYSPWLLENDYTGTTDSPRGRFIKEAFYLERQAFGKYGAQPSTGDYLENYRFSETTSSAYRPSTVAFYAGRVWYAGLEGKDFTSNIYYSQVIGDRIENASKCYQEADPTAEVINELVATDGGVLSLEEVGKIYRMAPIGPSLVVIADNGTWVISGDGEFSSFRADSFSVRKVTDQGALSATSVAFAKDTLYYWGQNSITAILLGQQGAIVAQDVSSQSIKSFYQRIDNFARQRAFSAFDEGANKVLWFYEEEPGAAFVNLKGKAYNKVLVLDLGLGSYSKYTLAIQTGILPVAAFGADTSFLRTIIDPVTDSEIQVTAGGEDVTTTSTAYLADKSSVKVMTITNGVGYDYRFSEFTDVTDFADWDTSYDSYLESGFDSLQDVVSRGKQGLMIQTHFERTETGFVADGDELALVNPSGCICSYAWDWEEAPYRNPFYAYKLLLNYTPADASDPFDYDKTVISTRNRIRGRGTALGIRFESEEGKDFRLLGYGIIYSNRGRP